MFPYIYSRIYTRFLKYMKIKHKHKQNIKQKRTYTKKNVYISCKSLKNMYIQTKIYNSQVIFRKIKYSFRIQTIFLKL